MALPPFLLIFRNERFFLPPRRMRRSALLRYGCFVPVWVYCGAFPQDIRPVWARKMSLMMKRATQRIRYVRTSDGVQLAWAEPGAGAVTVNAADVVTAREDGA